MNAPQPPGRDPEQLERSAERIRADLDRTLDALERKLSPSQLLDRSLGYLREHGGELTRTVGDTVRRNPVPILLTVAGIGWLVVSSLRPRHPVDEAFGDESPSADAHYDEARQRSKFQDRVAATRERLYAAGERTRRAQDRVVSAVEERPILLGGLAVAIGALIGAVIPSTQYEDRTVGQIRDRAVERAKQMGERQYQNLRSRLETHRDLEVSGQAH
jgi:ElaB/YqjD/DUF883 family membrane-anchored ribosome-binding protein